LISRISASSGRTGQEETDLAQNLGPVTVTGGGVTFMNTPP
jgi:hypothetical protein